MPTVGDPVEPADLEVRCRRFGGRSHKVIDHGWTRWRRYPFLVVVHVHAGGFIAETLQGEHLEISAAQTLVLPATLPNRVRSEGPCELSYCHLAYRDGHGRDPLRAWTWPHRLVGRAAAEAETAIVSAEEAVLGPSQDALSVLRATAYTRAALDLLSVLVTQGRPLPDALPPACHPALPPVFDAITTHLARPLSRTGLARLAGLSPSRFTAVFQEATGETPAAFIERLRLEAAHDRLIETRDPVAAVAAAVGYADPFHFSRRFRQRFGASPSAVRQRSGP